MGTVPDKYEVESFLRDVKEKIKVFDMIVRRNDKNLNFLKEFEMNPYYRNDYIMNLKYEDCFAGPKKDTYDHEGMPYFEFGILINGKEIYIKISKGRERKAVDCMSFHEAEYPINYPFR